MVRYNYLVPIVAKPCFTFSYLGVSFIDFQKEKTPQSLEITAFLVRLPGLEPGASGLGEQITLCPTIPLHCIPLRFVSI